MFQVTTVLPEPHLPIGKVPTFEKVGDEHKKEEEKKDDGKKKKVDKKRKGDKPTTEVTEEVKADETVAAAEEKIPFEDRKVNYKKDLFGKPSYLTVSGQLSVENFCCALSDVYTFGPTFRAENSHTSRHLSEFWMIEPELAFATLEDNMDCAE